MHAVRSEKAVVLEESKLKLRLKDEELLALQRNPAVIDRESPFNSPSEITQLEQSTEVKDEKCADEDDACLCTGTVYMALSSGAGSRLVYPGKVDGRILCAVSKFGRDLAYGQQKFCFCEGLLHQIDPMRPQHATSVAQLPSYLQEIGLSVFGSQELLSEAVEGMSEPQEIAFSTWLEISGGERSLWMVQGKQDNGIGRSGHLINEYGIEDIKENDGNLMVDIGANIGLVTIASAMLHPRLKICSFEPVDWSLQLH